MKPGFYPVLWLVMGAVSMSAQTERTVSFRGGPTIAITVPMGYSFDYQNLPDASVRLVMENPVWNIQIVALVAQETDPAATKRAWQEDKLVSFVAAALTVSREEDYVFRPLPAASGTGIYCVFTAQGATTPPPGESIPGSYWTGGLKAWPGCVVIFRIVSPDKTSLEYQEAVQLFTTSFTKL